MVVRASSVLSPARQMPDSLAVSDCGLRVLWGRDRVCAAAAVGRVGWPALWPRAFRAPVGPDFQGGCAAKAGVRNPARRVPILRGCDPQGRAGQGWPGWGRRGGSSVGATCLDTMSCSPHRIRARASRPSEPELAFLCHRHPASTLFTDQRYALADWRQIRGALSAFLGDPGPDDPDLGGQVRRGSVS